MFEKLSLLVVVSLPRVRAPHRRALRRRTRTTRARPWQVASHARSRPGVIRSELRHSGARVVRGHSKFGPRSV
jgi:hypothetical protein